MKAVDAALVIRDDLVEVNVVPMRGVNEDDTLDFMVLARTKNAKVRFIEYIPCDGNVWSTDKIIPDHKRIK